MYERPRHGRLADGQRLRIGNHPGHHRSELVPRHGCEQEHRQRGDAGPAADLPGHQPPDRNTDRQPVEHYGQGVGRIRIERQRGQRRAVHRAMNDDARETGEQRQAMGCPRGPARGFFDRDGNQEPTQ